MTETSALLHSYVTGDIVKLLAAILVGSLIGAERELRGKAAGVRTMTLITLGSTLFTMFSIAIASPSTNFDPGRIAAQIVTGVGFLGAGAILHDRWQITGLTTAASIWLASSLGIGIGLGAWRLTFVACFVVLFVLSFFSRIEEWLELKRDVQVYIVELALHEEGEARIRAIAREHHLALSSFQMGKKNKSIRMSFRAVGSAAAHEAFVKVLLFDPDVIEFNRYSHDKTAAS